MKSISIRELHEHTEDWVRRATEEEPIILKDNGRPVARIVPIPAPSAENPFPNRKLLPGFAELQSRLRGGTDSTEIVSEMRDGR
jgi:prevent-host-death family protein